MGHPVTKESAAAILFLALYTALAGWMYFCYATKRYTFKSRWTMLAFHTTVRVASQACGVAFSILAFSNVSLFIAYLVLSAEGYFTLVLASYYFLRHFQLVYLGHSWLEADHSDMTKNQRRRKALAVTTLQPVFLFWRYYKTDFLAIVHSILIPANAIIITGGSYLSGTLDSDSTPDEIADRLNTAKALRSAGQAMFFVCACAYVVCVFITLLQMRELRQSRRAAHPTLLVFLVISFFLCIRGMFGILQAAVTSLSYTSPTNYTDEGFTSRFTAIEYCLTVLPEFMSAFLLNMTYFTSSEEKTGEMADIKALSRKELA